MRVFFQTAARGFSHSVVRGQLSIVEQRIAALRLLKQELEQVMAHIPTSSGPHGTGVCRCLDAAPDPRVKPTW